MSSRRSSVELLSPPRRNSGASRGRRLSVDLINVNTEYKRYLNNLSETSTSVKKRHSVPKDEDFRDSDSFAHLENVEEASICSLRAINVGIERRQSDTHGDLLRDDISDVVRKNYTRRKSVCVSETISIQRAVSDLTKTRSTSRSSRCKSEEGLDVNGTDKRKSILKSANFIDVNVFNAKVRNIRRSSISHVDSVKLPKVSDCVSAARKVLKEIDKEKQHDVKQSNNLYDHFDTDINQKDAQTNGSDKLPDKWYHFKEQVMKDNACGSLTGTMYPGARMASYRCSLEDLVIDEIQSVSALLSKPDDEVPDAIQVTDEVIKGHSPSEMIKPEQEKKTDVVIVVSPVPPENSGVSIDSKIGDHHSTKPHEENTLQIVEQDSREGYRMSDRQERPPANRTTRSHSLVPVSEPQLSSNRYDTNTKRMSMSDPFALPSIFQQHLMKVHVQELNHNEEEEQHDSLTRTLSSASSAHSRGRATQQSRSRTNSTSLTRNTVQRTERNTPQARTRSKSLLPMPFGQYGVRRDSSQNRKASYNFGSHTEARVNIRHDHSYQLRKHLSSIEKQLPTKTLLEIKRLKESGKPLKHVTRKTNM